MHRVRPIPAPPHPLAVRVGSWVPVVLWMGVIFAFSSSPSLPQASYDLLDTLIKKGAHLAEFAVLAILLYRALRPTERQDRRSGLLAIGLAVAYAVTDELHQAFVPGRHPSPVDVGVDTVGSMIAIIGLGVFRSGVRGFWPLPGGSGAGAPE